MSAPAVRVAVPGETGTPKLARLDGGAIMTTLGKILIFCVFVAALAMGGLMVYVSKATPGWKEIVQDRDDKIKVFEQILKQEVESRKKLIIENERMKQLLDNKSIESSGAVSKLNLEINDKEN